MDFDDNMFTDDDTDDIFGVDDTDDTDSDDLDFDDDPPILDVDTSSGGGGKISAEKANDFKKTGLMLLGIGILILIVAVVGLRVVKSSKQAKVKQGNQIVQTVNPSNGGVNQQTQNSVPSQNVVVSAGQNSGTTTWQEVDLTGVDLGQVWIDSSFTVTEIKHYASVTNLQNDKQVKSVVKGNISGLVGTYEVEIPTYQALELKFGSTFKITYQLKDQGSYKIVGHIRY